MTRLDCDFRTFPIMVPYYHEHLRGPRSVPWWLVEPFEDRAKKNHGGQTLERLAERGGLAPRELLHVLTDKPWQSFPDLDDQGALDEIVRIQDSHMIRRDPIQ